MMIMIIINMGWTHDEKRLWWVWWDELSYDRSSPDERLVLLPYYVWKRKLQILITIRITITIIIRMIVMITFSNFTRENLEIERMGRRALGLKWSYRDMRCSLRYSLFSLFWSFCMMIMRVRGNERRIRKLRRSEVIIFCKKKRGMSLVEEERGRRYMPIMTMMLRIIFITIIIIMMMIILSLVMSMWSQILKLIVIDWLWYLMMIITWRWCRCDSMWFRLKCMKIVVVIIQDVRLDVVTCILKVGAGQWHIIIFWGGYDVPDICLASHLLFHHLFSSQKNFQM